MGRRKAGTVVVQKLQEKVAVEEEDEVDVAQSDEEGADDSAEDEEDDDEDGMDGDEEDGEDEEEEEEEEAPSTNDGLADMMSRILNQNVGAKAVPVLAKRKTALMKEIETDQKETRDLKRLRLERKVDRSKQMVAPDASTADLDRQLKKLATRGVVALFNAIAKVKRETVAQKEDAAAEKSAKAESNKSELAARAITGTTSLSTSITDKKEKPKAKAPAAEEAGSRGWAALRDDYMLGSELTVKTWDKAADSESEQE